MQRRSRTRGHDKMDSVYCQHYYQSYWYCHFLLFLLRTYNLAQRTKSVHIKAVECNKEILVILVHLRT